MSSSPPMRGRRGWERRLAERDGATGRTTGERPEFDSAEAEIEAHATSQARVNESAAASAPKRQGPGRRIPNLSGLTRLVDGTGAFEALRGRLGPIAAPAAGGGRHAGVTAVPHGAKSYLAAALALVSGERIVWVARDSEIGDRVAEELGAWVGDPAAVAVLEPRTALAYERSELVADETAARVAALSAWRSGTARILVASVQALIQHTIAAADLPEQPMELQVGARVAQSTLLRELLELGYQPVLEVAGRGEFARRGGIVDVFPPSAELPVRIESFGDEIDSLRTFDPTDQRTTGKVERVVLLPASEFLVPAGGVDELRAMVGSIGRKLPDRLAQDLDRLAGTPDPAHARSRDESRAAAVGDAAEVWAPLLAPATALDHIGPETLLVLDEPGDIGEAAAFLWRQADERRVDLLGAGELPRDWPSTLLGPREWKRRLLAARTLELTWESEAANALAGGSKSSGDLFGWREPVLPPGRGGRIAEAVDRWLGEDGATNVGGGSDESRPRIVIASDQAPRLAEILDEGGHAAGVTDAITAAPPPGSVSVVDRSLNGGFAGGPDGLVFVTDRELFGNVRVRRPKAMRRVVPRDILERLTPGDLVVHIDHGIARYERMLRRSSGTGDERDFLELAFQGQDRIYVPVEQIGRISRYSGGESPHLSKLGGTEWLRTKARVRKAVGDLAEELLALYAGRAAAPGHAYPQDSPWQAEMEAAFPYEETVDQLRAAVEVKHDMQAVRPMDRLVVGDVGYGKTEIAIRAAFKATQDGKQVAVLVPTTVLAAQHHATFSQRFGPFPVKVALLSRCVSKGEQDKAVQGLADGSLDLVIGTHRLLSKDVRF
ncbi:MAG TPA: CarD family transcriptional regulator, partial [Candidatus Limnocylindrales bacterium]|nr:CarD family transcriptional regulator [Candidatus Limnocylindrales bacterium]